MEQYNRESYPIIIFGPEMKQMISAIRYYHDQRAADPETIIRHALPGCLGLNFVTYYASPKMKLEADPTFNFRIALETEEGDLKPPEPQDIEAFHAGIALEAGPAAQL